jgi:RimJ/RimL family protein N-acetyltransferase
MSQRATSACPSDRLISVTTPPASLRFMALDAALVQQIEPWFDDEQTRRYLGGRNWIRRELRLIAEVPGRVDGAVVVVGRWGWVAFEDDVPVGVIGAERYDDGTASTALTVAPGHRSRGVGRRMLSALLNRPELGGVIRIVGGVEPDNLPSIRCLTGLGADLSEEVDHEGMLAVSIPVGD